MQSFRTLTGIIDDYFDGYYSEEMIESQVYISALFFCCLEQIKHFFFCFIFLVFCCMSVRVFENLDIFAWLLVKILKVLLCR